MKENLYGAIVLGIQSIDLCIVELKTLKLVERARSAVSIGENIFTDRLIHPEMVAATCNALLGFKQILADYGVAEPAVFASHTILEAQNAAYVSDQIFIKTGLHLVPLNQSQESFYRTEATALTFPRFKEITQQGTLLVDVNSGSVNLTIFNAGRFILSRNLKVGPLRVFETLRDIQRTAPNYIEILQDYIDSKVVDFNRFLPQGIAYEQVIVMGSSLAIFQPLLPEHERALALSTSEFDALYAEISTSTPSYLQEKYQLAPELVPLALPLVLLLHQLFKSLPVKQIWLSDLRLVDGVVVHRAVDQGKYQEAIDFTSEIMTSAKNLAHRYQVDPAHGQQVLTFATQLFDRLRKIHGLGARERLLLRIAATVQDVGTFIDTQTHYEHSDYIIRSSAIIGLSDEEQVMVATIARYHSATSPANELSQLTELSLEKRLVIAKLAAMLRLADALDDSRQQKVEKIQVSLKKSALLITATAKEDIELEKFTFGLKAAFFEEVFGLQADLKRK